MTSSFHRLACVALAAVLPVLDSRAEPKDCLTGYRLTGPPIPIAGIEDLSGITYCGASDTLFAVLNGDTMLLEMTGDGQVKRRVALRGFHDTEDVAWLEGTRFAVVEERRRNLCLFDVGAETTEVAYTNATQLPVDAGIVDNMGLEGVTLDREAACFYIVKEKGPRKIYAVRMKSADKPEVAISIPWDLEAVNLGMTDVASICWDAARQCLFILSDESKCLVQCTKDGHEIARLKLTAGKAGLENDIPQPEGVTFDPRGRLYIVSEPNLLHVFERPDP